MVKMQLTVLALVLVVCSSNAEARGRRMARQQVYTPYYNTVPAANTAAPTGVVATNSVPAPASAMIVQDNGIIQASGTATTGTVVTANSVAPASTVVSGTVVGASGPAAVGSAQWKAEQSARLGSVQHLGGGFGGGSYEGNGFGATPDQAIQNSCFWGQRTPIEIGVARGANGYYATIFYR